MPRPGRLSAFLTSAALLSFPCLARADGTEKCIAASEHAQELRNAGKLAAAKDELAICGAADCPKIIQTDCARWMSEILSSIPTVVPAVKDARGRDIVEARFLIDGKLVAESLDGKSVAVDPGAHVFRFEAVGKTPQEERVAVRAGEQNRIVTVTLANAIEPQASPAAQPVSPSGKPFPILPVALGAAGVILLGVALYMDLGATSDAHDLRSTCAPSCRPGDVDDIRTRYLIAGIGAGVGAAALIGAGVLYFTRSSSKVGLSLRPTLDGAMAQGRISF